MKTSEELYTIYQNSSYGTLWPISAPDFERILFTEGPEIEVTVTREAEGFSILKTKDGVGSLALITHADRNLLEKTLSAAKEKKVKEIFFGHKVGKYMWPGLPSEPDTIQFFLKHGFNEYWEDPAVDMLLELAKFQPEQKAYDRIAEDGYSFSIATKLDIEQILRFEQTEFPNWTQYYQKAIAQDHLDHLVLIKDKSGKIVGTSMLSYGGYRFHKLLPGLTGSVGAVGIAKDLRGNGLGTAMLAKTLELLRKRGVKYALAEYTSEVGFYERLGFKSWRSYYMIRRTL